MKSDKTNDKNGPIKPLMPKITNDEIDLEVDDKRDDEIKNDRPPHHG